MRSQHDFRSALLVGLVAFGLGCGGTMNTGTAKKPVNNKPAADGTCPAERTRCGTGAFAVCVDLQNDPDHCGTCDRACSPGIACQTGVCQQTVCTGTSVPLSGRLTTSTSDTRTSSAGVSYFFAKKALADVNGDGRLDLIASDYQYGTCSGCGVGADEFRVSLGEPGGTFAPPDTYRASGVIDRFFTADVNSDGMTDLYVVSATPGKATVAPYHVELWLGQEDGHLRRAEAAGLSADGMADWDFTFAVGDLSGDGWPDLVMEAPDSDLEAPPKIAIYLSDSTGALHWSQTFVGWAGRTFIRDANGDGSPDLVLLWQTVEILYNRGNGIFDPPVNCALSVGNGAWGVDDIVVEDFNRDGWMDLAAGDEDRVGVMLGLGGCRFAPVTYYDTPGSSIGLLRAGDINGDGILDLVSVSTVSEPDPKNPTGGVSITKDNLLAVLLGNSDGTFHLSDTVTSLGPLRTADIAIGEATGDQRPDIVITTAGQSAPQTLTWENTCQ